MQRLARAACLALLLVAPARAEKAAPAPSFFPTEPKPAAPAAETKPAPKPDKDAPPPVLSADEVLERLDLRGRLAQLLLVTLQGELGPNSADIAFLKGSTPGAVLIRQAGLPSEAQLYAQRVRSAPPLLGLPILVGCDMYSLARGDRGAASQFVELPSLLSLAAARDSGATEHFGHLLAEHLRGMGFDMSLGPSLELAPTVPGVRGSIYTFGSSPDFAAEAGASLVKALADAGVAAVPTGFPGGGANRRGKEPAVLTTPRAELAQRDAFPYARAIAAGAGMIHVGNVLVPGLDETGAPASISHDVIQAYLRDTMHFDGLVIAGPLDVPDVTSKFNPAEAAQRAILAGADLLYFITPLNTPARVLDKLVAAVEAGDVPRSLVDRAARRVVAFKLARATATVEASTEKDAKKLEGKKALAEEAYAVERKAITLIKNASGVLPLAKDRSVPLGVTGVIGTEVITPLLEKPLKQVVQQPIGTAKHLGEIQDFEIDRLTHHAEGIRTAVVLLTDQMRTAGAKRLISGLKAKGAKVVVVLLGYPGNAAEYLAADAIILAYCDGATYGETLKAVGDVLLGKPPITLRSDLGEMQVKVGEARNFNALDIVRAPAGRLPVALGPSLPEGFSTNYGGDALVKNAEWDFGDGAQAKDLQTTYTYTKPGNYTLTVRVQADNKEIAEQHYQVNVTP